MSYTQWRPVPLQQGDSSADHQWPKAVGSRRPAPAQNQPQLQPSQSQTHSAEPRNPGAAKTYQKQQLLQRQQQLQQQLQQQQQQLMNLRVSSPMAGRQADTQTWKSPQTYAQAQGDRARATSPTLYRPVTPPSSPPHVAGQSPAVPAAVAGGSSKQAVPLVLRMGAQKEIKPQTAGNTTRSLVSPTSFSRSSSPRCICHRDHTKVMCYVCGKTRTGRVRLQCPDHPNTIHLMDFDRCPNCKAVNLAEMRSRSRPH